MSVPTPLTAEKGHDVFFVKKRILTIKKHIRHSLYTDIAVVHPLWQLTPEGMRHVGAYYNKLSRSQWHYLSPHHHLKVALPRGIQKLNMLVIMGRSERTAPRMGHFYIVAFNGQLHPTVKPTPLSYCRLHRSSNQKFDVYNTLLGF